MLSVTRQSNGSYQLAGHILEGDDPEIERFRGYTGIGIYNVKNEINIAGLFRSAFAFGVNFVFTIGARYKYNKQDTPKATKHIPLFNFKDENQFFDTIPLNSKLVAVDNDRNFRIPKSIHTFVHPERVIYILGSEANGLPNSIIKRATHYIEIPNCRTCLNVSTAGSLILFDRQSKQKRA